MKNLFVLSLLLLLSPSLLFAFTVKRNYNLTAPKFTKLDQKCLRALKKEIVPAFVGLSGVDTEQSPSFFLGDGRRDTIHTYAGMNFKSDYGNVRGTLNCVFDANSNRVSVVTVTFEGRGLAGFKKHPMARTLNDPSKQRALSYSAE